MSDNEFLDRMTGKEYMGMVAQLGCACCRKLGRNNVPAEVHHRTGAGMGKRASDFETMPLCPGHHRFWFDAVHVNRRLFELTYGTEMELVEQTRAAVDLLVKSVAGGDK